jgi:hypothetical protein
MNLFLKILPNNFNKYSSKGIDVLTPQGINFNSKGILLHESDDLPASALTKNMAGHGAYDGCMHCLIHGELSANDSGIGGTVYYPYDSDFKPRNLSDSLKHGETALLESQNVNSFFFFPFSFFPIFILFSNFLFLFLSFFFPFSFPFLSFFLLSLSFFFLSLSFFFLYFFISLFLYFFISFNFFFSFSHYFN